MTAPTCTAAECDRPAPDAYLCAEDTWRLERVLAELPGLLDDLEVTRTRADKIAPAGNRSRRAATVEGDVPCWCGCTKPDPLHHRRRHGHEFRAATRVSDVEHARPDLGSAGNLPIAVAAVNVRQHAIGVVTTWCRDALEVRGLHDAPLVAGPLCTPLGCVHESCGAIRAIPAPRRAVDLGTLLRWLLTNVPSIRLSDGAGQLLWDMDDLRRRIRHVVDRPPDRVYAGPCACELDLYAPARFLTDRDANAITCDGWNSDRGEGCGQVHTYADRRAFLLDSLEGHTAPLGQLLPLLCQLLPAPEPPRRVVWNWRSRGAVPVVGVDRDGVELVSAADLAAQLRRYVPMPQRATKRGAA